MYNDEDWIEFIEKKDGKEFYEYYQGFKNAVEYQSNRVKNILLIKKQWKIIKI